MKILALIIFLCVVIMYIGVVAFIVRVLSYRENRDNFLSIVGVLIIILGAIALGVMGYYGYPIISN